MKNCEILANICGMSDELHKPLKAVENERLEQYLMSFHILSG